MAKTNAEVYAAVTGAIIEQLKKGVVPWDRPWSKVGHGAGIPVNASSGRAYNGINAVSLMVGQWAAGYTTAGWVTFKQAIAAGAVVRKGEKSTPIVWFSKRPKRNEETGEMDGYIWLARMYYVFNLDQLTDLKKEGAVAKLRARIGGGEAAPSGPEWDAVAEVEEMVHASGMSIETFGNQPQYVPALDLIQMPPRSAFPSATNFYGTLLHEMVHATGHSSRLAREGVKDMIAAPDVYAREELVAELGASFLGAAYGIDHVSRAASYIDSWLKKLGDPDGAKWMAQAATKASEAANWLLERAGYSLGSEEEEEPEEVAA